MDRRQSRPPDSRHQDARDRRTSGSRAGVDEQEAFRRLQKLASSKNLKLVEIARTLAATDEATRE
ncbi:MAG: ANTAR domain-containing protein [Thermoguttaceae bacterium]|nr:ANTAR domain-containing protein [Thermoguttaceae bacterium]